MNTNLVYAVSNFKDFVDNGEWMNNSISTFYNPQSLNKDDIFAIANQCRIGNAAPTFADDTKFLPTNVVAGDAEAVVVSASVTPLAVQSESVTPMATTKTPIQNQITQVSKLSQNDKKLLEYIGIGLGIIVLYKILS